MRTEAASYTIQSLVGYILPSHQFLHSIQTSCFLIPINTGFRSSISKTSHAHLRCLHSSALDSLFILHLHLPCFHFICAPPPYPILLSNPLTVNHVDKQLPHPCHNLITITGHNLTRSKRELLELQSQQSRRDLFPILYTKQRRRLDLGNGELPIQQRASSHAIADREGYVD